MKKHEKIYILEEVIADMPELPAMKFAFDVLTAFEGAAQSVSSFALGAVADTITLAEHHIYGSSRLGIQTYDTLYRNTFAIDTSITPLFAVACSEK